MPIAPPNSFDEIISCIRIYRSEGVGPATFHKLRIHCDEFDEALEVLQSRMDASGRALYRIESADKAKREYERGQKFGANFIPYGGEDYPALLAESADCPPFLWTKGDQSLLEKNLIAVIGSRNPSLDGVRITHRLAKLLNYENVVVSSGLARGIDAAAHESALSGGTVAVVAGGLDIQYPRSNAELQKIISEDGLLIGEMPFGYKPIARDFPRRNRIIAGISLAVLVIEGNLRSGTRLTVNDASTLGREILAVPGHPFQPLSALPNQLIKDGAGVICDIDDILEYVPALQRKNSKSTARAEPMPTHSEPAPKDAAALGRALIEGEAMQMIDGQIQQIPSSVARKDD